MCLNMNVFLPPMVHRTAMHKGQRRLSQRAIAIIGGPIDRTEMWIVTTQIWVYIYIYIL